MTTNDEIDGKPELIEQIVEPVLKKTNKTGKEIENDSSLPNMKSDEDLCMLISAQRSNPKTRKPRKRVLSQANLVGQTAVKRFKNISESTDNSESKCVKQFPPAQLIHFTPVSDNSKSENVEGEMSVVENVDVSAGMNAEIMNEIEFPTVSPSVAVTERLLLETTGLLSRIDFHLSVSIGST